jgi:hypothetical protein
MRNTVNSGKLAGKAKLFIEKQAFAPFVGLDS